MPAQHPHELITYGGNGAVFPELAQYLLTMKYLSEMTEDQNLTMYSGHPMGLFPSHKEAPRVVCNGMVIPNYSQPDDWEKMNALGVSNMAKMTAGSYMYIGPKELYTEQQLRYLMVSVNKKSVLKAVYRHLRFRRYEWRPTQSR
jgi:urocanate hydratase